MKLGGMMNRKTILLADDHSIIRDGLRSILEKEFEVVGALKDGRTLLKEAERLKPDVVVADISMPVLNGIEATRQLRRSLPRTKVVILTMHADVIYATEVFEAGASAYVLKSGPSEEVLAAVRDVLAGEKYVSPQLASELPAPPSERIRKHTVQLTTRQREVLQLLAEGRSAKEIADLLSISPRTVEFHKYNMMHVLQLRSMAELIRYAIRHHILPANDCAVLPVDSSHENF